MWTQCSVWTRVWPLDYDCGSQVTWAVVLRTPGGAVGAVPRAQLAFQPLAFQLLSRIGVGVGYWIFPNAAHHTAAAAAEGGELSGCQAAQLQISSRERCSSALVLLVLLLVLLVSSAKRWTGLCMRPLRCASKNKVRACI